MQSILKIIQSPEQAMNDMCLLRKAIDEWGNRAFSAWEGYLGTCIAHTLFSTGPILECGSGLTTAICGGIAKSRNIPYWALEQADEYALMTHSRLELLEIHDHVNIISCGLKSYGDYDWYNVPFDKVPLPDDFSLVICDGPRGDTRGGRYGLLPVMICHLRPYFTILLDDFHRPAELLTSARWSMDYSLQCSGKFGDAMKGYAILRRSAMRQDHPREAGNH